MLDGGIKTYKYCNNSVIYNTDNEHLSLSCVKETNNLRGNVIEKMEYNHDGQMLTILGNDTINKRLNLRVINTFKMEMYNCFSGSSSAYSGEAGNVLSYALSKDSKKLMIANTRGEVIGYKIRHYNNR